MRRAPAVVALIAAVALTACSHKPPVPATEALPPGPFLSCPARVSDGSLPDLTLPCFAGGAPVRLGGFGKPAVINVWASWCGPCISELPQIQRYAREAGDRLVVLGVVTEDDANSAASLATDLRLTFPAVYDRGGELRKALGRTALPITLFVDPTGRLAFTYEGPALSHDRLAALVKQHLGVAVA